MNELHDILLANLHKMVYKDGHYFINDIEIIYDCETRLIRLNQMYCGYSKSMLVSGLTHFDDLHYALVKRMKELEPTTIDLLIERLKA